MKSDATMTPARRRFALIVVAGPDRLGRPAEQVLRQWLKLGLRGFGLRCVDAREIERPAPAGEETPL